MKKLITLIISIVVCLCGTALLGGCSSSDKPNLPAKVNNGEWIEIQSITYYTNHYNHTYVSNETKLESRCYVDIESEIISKTEYEKASDEQKSFGIYSTAIYLDDINIDFYTNRKNYISTLKKWVNKTFYSIYYNPDYPDYNTEPIYSKSTIKSYELYYVRVRFLDSNSLEINYNNYNENQNSKPQDYNTTIRVLPLSYTITYFND